MTSSEAGGRNEQSARPEPAEHLWETGLTPEEPLGAVVQPRREGHIEHLGVSNFSRSQLRTGRDVAAALRNPVIEY
jgi:aryl-alcohol dehydrogenase-like predicted oxidoreductase